MHQKKKKARIRKKKSLFDIQWNANYDLLKKFRKRFNHVNVPQHWEEDKALGRWVIRQRVRKKYLPDERIKKLNQINFIWDIPSYLWELSYQKLVEYKTVHGHCKVPKGKTEFYQLSEWVGKQRRDKKESLKRLTPNKIAKLNKLRFYWGKRNTAWETRFKELKKFKSRFGHCRVPQGWSENKPLSYWVAMQRKKFRKLDKERVRKLNSIHFE